MEMKKVIIVGGGFGGIHLAKGLSKSNDYKVVLVDINNYNFFPPLLYQVATAFIEPSNISYPFRRLFNDWTHTRFHMGRLIQINQQLNSIETDTGTLSYDCLVLAM